MVVIPVRMLPRLGRSIRMLARLSTHAIPRTSQPSKYRLITWRRRRTKSVCRIILMATDGWQRRIPAMVVAPLGLPLGCLTALWAMIPESTPLRERSCCYNSQCYGNVDVHRNVNNRHHNSHRNSYRTIHRNSHRNNSSHRYSYTHCKYSGCRICSDS